METLKQDVTRLYSITDYAKLKGVSRQTVYNWISDPDKKIVTVTISGKQFIKMFA